MTGFFLSLTFSGDGITPKPSGNSPETAPHQPASPCGDPYFMVMILAMFAIVYFLMIRPARKQEKQRQMMLANIKKNDRVITSGGIIGTVYSIKDNEVVLKIDVDGEVKVSFTKSAIVGIIKPAGPEEQKS